MQLPSAPSDIDLSVDANLLAKVALYTDGLIIISDSQDHILWVNQSFIERTGYTLDELQGKKPADVLRGSKTNSKVATEIDKASKEGAEFEGEILNYTKDGEPFWLNLTMNPIKGEEGETDYFISIGKEITARKQKEKQLKKSKERAERIASEKQDIISVLSHDIKSPLTSIIGSIDLLKDESLSHDQLELLNIMMDASKNMERLVENMLEMAKIESGDFPIFPKTINLHELLNEIINPLKVQAHSSENELTLAVDDNLKGDFKVDPLRFSQVINNLVSNAIKFTDNGKIEVTVTEVDSTPRKSDINIEVKDTGCGISKEAQQKVFAKFKQADQSVSQKYGGSGLGLTITRYIVYKMDGDIRLKSQLGEGTSFYIDLTLEKAVVDN